MRRKALLAPALLVAVFAGAVQSQPLTREVFVSVAQGRLFRIGDNPLDSGPNVGAGVGLLHRSGLGVDIGLNRTFGLRAKPAACGVVNIPCEGSAREGTTAATIFSVDARYEFTRARVRPYVTGGVGALRSSGFSPTLYISEQRAVFSEQEWSDTGLAFNVGGGVRIRLGERLSIRPELRVYNGVALSRANLCMFRPSVVLAYSW
jgi:opacity protein-like surface antigen